MAYSPISFIAPNYRDFDYRWLKAYVAGTTSPKVMALESDGGTQVSKLQLNADGFIVSAGQALVIPYIDSAYDLWLFPTATEADSNDTSNAIRVANNITAGFGDGDIDDEINNALINDLSQAYEFPTVAAFKSSGIEFPDGKVINLLDRKSEYTKISGVGAGNDMDLIASSTVSQSISISDYDGDIEKLGAISGLILNAIIERSLVISDRATLKENSFDVLVSAPFEVAAGKTINFGSNSMLRDISFTANSLDVMFNHVGDGSVIKNVEYDDITSTGRLIGYSSGANNCIEDNCGTGRGNAYLIRFEGVENNNYSKTLANAANGNVLPLITGKRMTAIYDADAGTLAFNRVRHMPSRCTITHLKVTDLNGSPNFYFDLAMRDGLGATFGFPFTSTPFGTGDIDLPVQIDWFYASFDDILSFNLRNDKGAPTQFEIEIFYSDGISGRDDIAWTYQSTYDFNRPHDYGSTSIAEAVRSPEYRSTIDGVGLDVQGATTSKSAVAGYGYPETTIPTPAGIQDLTATSELKFYFHFSAGMALSSGATHIRFRLYQQTRQIKCTCINGFLSQKPDWSAGAPHLAVSFQPDLEVNMIGSARDNPQEVLIPLDRKAMFNAVNEEFEQDLKYFYLTFFQNLPGHTPIEWGDVWEWECDFIRS